MRPAISGNVRCTAFVFHVQSLNDIFLNCSNKEKHGSNSEGDLIRLIPSHFQPLLLFPSVCRSRWVTLFTVDSGGWEQRKDAVQANPPGRPVVRGTKSLTVPNWDGAVRSTQAPMHEEARPRTGTTLRDCAADLWSTWQRGSEKRVESETGKGTGSMEMEGEVEGGGGQQEDGT